MFARMSEWLLGRFVMRKAARLARQFDLAAEQAIAGQRRVLMEKLARNADSQFGREHDFAAIRGVDDFRKALPIRTYEDHEPYIEQVKAGRLDALFGPGQKVHMFAMSSGTLGRPKFIPVTDTFLAEYRRGWMVWGLHFFAAHPKAMFKPILQLVSSPDAFRTAGGIPCGSISGLITQMQRGAVRRMYCLPPAIGRVKDTRAKFYTALRLAVPESIGFLTTANPNTLVQVAQVGIEHAEALIRDLAQGL